MNKASWRTSNGVTRIACKSIAEFAAVYAEHFANRRNYIYRGHASYRWKLESSLTRVIRNRMIRNREELDHLRYIAESDFPTAFLEFLYHLEVIGDREIRDMIRQYFELWDKSQSASIIHRFEGLVTGEVLLPEQQADRRQLQHLEFQLLAIAQHYGMPTPLLDWSHSPFVGWYFALREPSSCFPTVIAIGPGIWQTYTERWLDIQANILRKQIDSDRKSYYQNLDDDNIPSSLVDQRKEMIRHYRSNHIEVIASFQQFPASTHINDRLQAQQGILTKHSVGMSLDQMAKTLCSDQSTNDNSLIYKFALVGESSEKAMTQLRMMNISGSTLFPGLAGAGQFGLDSIRFRGYSAMYGWSHHYGTA